MDLEKNSVTELEKEFVGKVEEDNSFEVSEVRNNGSKTTNWYFI